MTDSPAIQLQKFHSVERLLTPRGNYAYNAGIKDADKGHIRYASKSSDQPTLMIVNPISDDDGNLIMPGYYELALSDDRQMLILAQRQVVIATIPVFKVEEDRTKEQVAQPMDNWSQRKFDRAQKKKEKERKKLLKDGKITDLEPAVYNNATIEYDSDGDYYLIKYERDKIRAWGALKL